MPTKKPDNRQKFLLSFFPDRPGYETKEMNGFVLVKQYDGNTGRWIVAVYTPEGYKISQEFAKKNL